MNIKNIIKKSMAAASMLLIPALSFAQTSSSMYFLEGSTQRHQLNPAFEPERGLFLAVPILSNLNVDAQSSVGLSHFLFNSTSKPGMLTTFMSPDVSYSQFVNRLPDAAQVNLGLNMDILALGVRGNAGYTSFGIKLRNSEGVSIPKELFGFMKASLSNGNYLIQNTNISSITFLEARIAHSHQISDNLRIGAALKFLAGLEYADATIDEIDAQLADDSWKVRTNATLKTSLPGVRFQYNSDGTFDGIDNSEKYQFEVPTNYGFAVDLGAEYDFKGLVDGLKVSASISDLGMISWNGVTSFQTNNSEYVTFEGFKDYDATSDNDNSDMLDDIKEDFKDMIKLYKTNENGKENIALNATMRLGAEYEMPFMPFLSVGELITYRTGLWSYAESRTSVAVTPCDWLALSGNAGLSTMGPVYGFVVDIHPRLLNLFVAVDNLKADLNPQYIPLNDFGLNVSVGLNLAFGKKRTSDE